jgi:hypothetical protein
MRTTDGSGSRGGTLDGRALLVALLLIALAPIAGCGDGRFERAQHTVALSRRALLRVEETSGSEVLGEGEARAGIEPARQSAEQWLEQADEALGVWGGSGSLAFETMVPCLARSLGRLRDRLARHERPVPESLRQAEALARTATERRCPTRRRTRAHREPSEPVHERDSMHAEQPAHEPAPSASPDGVTQEPVPEELP